MTVLAGMALMPLSSIAHSDKHSYVSDIYFPVFDKSAIEIHLWSSEFQ